MFFLPLHFMKSALVVGSGMFGSYGGSFTEGTDRRDGRENSTSSWVEDQIDISPSLKSHESLSLFPFGDFTKTCPTAVIITVRSLFTFLRSSSTVFSSCNRKSREWMCVFIFYFHLITSTAALWSNRCWVMSHGLSPEIPLTKSSCKMKCTTLIQDGTDRQTCKSSSSFSRGLSLHQPFIQ